MRPHPPIVPPKKNGFTPAVTVDGSWAIGCRSDERDQLSSAMESEAMLELIPLTEQIGTKVRGIDVSAPNSDRDFERIYRAWIDTTTLLFRGQSLDSRQQVALTDRFGKRESYPRKTVFHRRCAGYPDPLQNPRKRESDRFSAERSGVAQRWALSHRCASWFVALRNRRLRWAATHCSPTCSPRTIVCPKR